MDLWKLHFKGSENTIYVIGLPLVSTLKLNFFEVSFLLLGLPSMAGPFSKQNYLQEMKMMDDGKEEEDLGAFPFFISAPFFRTTVWKND